MHAHTLTHIQAHVLTHMLLSIVSGFTCLVSVMFVLSLRAPIHLSVYVTKDHVSITHIYTGHVQLSLCRTEKLNLGSSDFLVLKV